MRTLLVRCSPMLNLMTNLMGLFGLSLLFSIPAAGADVMECAEQAAMGTPFKICSMSLLISRLPLKRSIESISG
mgnify:CR=1 FL=1